MTKQTIMRIERYNYRGGSLPKYTIICEGVQISFVLDKSQVFDLEELLHGGKTIALVLPCEFKNNGDNK